MTNGVATKKGSETAKGGANSQITRAEPANFVAPRIQQVVDIIAEARARRLRAGAEHERADVKS